jgi:hypothetical protein
LQELSGDAEVLFHVTDFGNCRAWCGVVDPRKGIGCQQPETRTPVGFELGALSARRFNAPYVETKVPQSAHVTG